MRVLAVALALLMLAGCLSIGGGKRPDYDAAQEEVVAAATPFLVLDHDHKDARLHNGSLNLELAGYHNGVAGGDGQDPDQIPAGVSYNEFVVTDEYAYLARSSTDGSVGGFVILSHKDPADPAKLTYVGEFDALGGADLEVSADETLAFFDTQRSGSTQPTAPLGSYDPTGLLTSATSSQSPGSALPRGIVVVDIADKRAPTLESYTPLPANGPHTLTYWQDPSDPSREYVIACTYDLITDPQTGALVGAVPATQRIVVYQVQRPPPAPVPGQPAAPVSLQPLSQFTITDSPPAGKLYFPHDTRVQVHPTYKGGSTPLLYVAYWDKGVRVLDFSQPSSLKEVGFFTEFGPTALNNIHLAQPFADPIGKDDRHITVAQPEIPTAPDETGQLTFLDTSDPEHPRQVGYWTLPNGTSGRLGITGFDFSPHNFDTWDGKVALAHFHAGVWVIDVSDDENLAHPKSVGYYMPSKPRTDSPVIQPNVWGVYEHQGLLWASDEATGLYVLRYTGP